MKVIYYNRKARSPFHIHAGSYASFFYVPDENIILYKEQLGTFGRNEYSLTDRAKILKEAKVIAEGRIPDVQAVSFFDIKEFEYESFKLRELIQNARLKTELETKVKFGIEDLLKQVNNHR